MKPLKLAALQCFNYAVVAANFRLVAQGHYLGAIMTDAVIASAGWTLTKLVVEAKTWQERAGYIVGSSVGSAIGIWLT
jgi:hypothetical protein